MNTEDEVRAKFEEWFAKNVNDRPEWMVRADAFMQGDRLSYCEGRTRDMYRAWQAALSLPLTQAVGAEAELAEMEAHGDADDVMEAGLRLERLRLAGVVPVAYFQDAAALGKPAEYSQVADEHKGAPDVFPLYRRPAMDVGSAVLAERERCAEVCDEIAGSYGTKGFDLAAGSAAENCAQAIREQDAPPTGDQQ